MNRIFSKCLYLGLAIYSASSDACFPVKLSLEERATQASHIAVGYVTGKFLDEFEQRLSNSELVIQTHESYRLRVKLIENIKGQFIKEIIYPQMSNCGSGKAGLKQKVLIFFDGTYWFVTAFDETAIKRVNEVTKIK